MVYDNEIGHALIDNWEYIFCICRWWFRDGDCGRSWDCYSSLLRRSRAGMSTTSVGRCARVYPWLKTLKFGTGEGSILDIIYSRICLFSLFCTLRRHLTVVVSRDSRSWMAPYGLPCLPHIPSQGEAIKKELDSIMGLLKAWPDVSPKNGENMGKLTMNHQ